MIRRFRIGVLDTVRPQLRGWLPVIAVAAVMLGMGCGETTAPPEPVATVAFEPATGVVIVPGGVELLNPVAKGASGKTLTGREAIWTSSDDATVQVAAGLVTGMKKGTATVSVSIEGKVASIDVEVRDGGVATAAGVSFSVLDGAVSVGVPPGAVAQQRNIWVRLAANPPPARRLVQGTSFEFGPVGAAFLQPVTVTVKYDPANVTQGSPESGLQLYEAVQGAWRRVAGSTVDVASRTVSGNVTQLGVYGVLMQPIVDTVRVVGPSASLPVRTSFQFTAVVKDSAGETLTRPLTWSSSAPAVLQIDAATGLANTLLPGTATVTATSEGRTGTSAVVVVPGPPAHMIRVTPETVNGAAGVALATPPAVRITDAFDNPIPGFTVTFTVATGGGTVTGGTAVTSANGFASPASWTLGTTVGTNTLTATATGLPQSPITFTAFGNPGAPATIAANSATSLTGTAGGLIGTLPSVKVTDAFANAVPGVTVTFAPASGSGSVTGGSAVTNSDGVATVGSWRLAPIPGDQQLLASVSGASGSPVTFTAAAAAPVPTNVTIVAGNNQTAVTLSSVQTAPAVRVTDPAGVPVPGLTVTFAIASGGGSVTSATPVTNADGVATLGSWILGPDPGQNTLTATAGPVAPVTFTATAVAPTPVAIAAVQGQNQTGIAGAAVSTAPAVKVTDDQNRGVPGVNVTFSVTGGGGSINGPATVATNSQGIATVGGWTLGMGANSLAAAANGLSGSPVVFNATGMPFIQIVTFGDSNTDYGYEGSNPTVRATSYVSNTPPRVAPDGDHSPFQLAGKIEAKWRQSRSETIKVVNHGIASSKTGSGRTGLNSPNALDVVGGLTRFQGEVLGLGYPWSGGEPFSPIFPSGPIRRVNAFQPRASDYAYVSLGTNDVGVASTDSIIGNLTRMVDMWVGAGLEANHFIITTLAPRDGSVSAAMPALNAAIRTLRTQRGLRLIDLAAFTSDNDGATWKNDNLHVDGDLLHYSETVRNWLADRVLEIINQ